MLAGLVLTISFIYISLAFMLLILIGVTCFPKAKQKPSIMGHMRKLLATASSPADGACADYTAERLSNLELEVAHHILSFLDFKDLTRLGSVSKRCRKFCLSTPSLEFSSSETGNRQQQFTLLNSIDRYMIHRGDDKIKYFHVDWNFCAGVSEEGFRMMTWILIAVRCHVEVLELKLWSREWDSMTLELPFASIFVDL